MEFEELKRVRTLSKKYLHDCYVIVASVRTIPRSCCVSTENSCLISVLLRNVNCMIYKPKPVGVEPNRTQPYPSNTVAQDTRENVQNKIEYL